MGMIKNVGNLSGFPENLPNEQLVEERLKKICKDVYELYGYVPIETPAVERFDVLVPESEHDGINKEIYKINRTVAEEESVISDRALRFDLTLPFARYVAQHERELSFPFKRYQIQKVWRGERPQAGRFREFYQSDIDVVNEGGLPLFFDAEVVQVAHEIFSRMELGGFTIRVNNRKLLQGILEEYGIETEKVPEALRIIDKLDKVGVDVVISLLQKEAGLTEARVVALINILTRRIELSETDSFFDSLKLTHLLALEGIAELREVFGYLKFMNMKSGKIVLDLCVARGLSYYTGCVFETVIHGYEKYGSMCSGGRYANLVGRFSKKSFPGVGVSIGLSRLLDVFLKKEAVLKYTERSVIDVFIILLKESQRALALRVAQNLRQKNISVDMYHDGNKKISKQIAEAEKKDIPYVLILNEDGSFEIKDMETREQVHVDSLDELELSYE